MTQAQFDALLKRSLLVHREAQKLRVSKLTEEQKSRVQENLIYIGNFLKAILEIAKGQQA